MYYYIYNYNIQYTADTFTKFIPNYKKNEIIQSSGSTKKYEIIEELGSGGQGTVFLVKKDNKYYALKKIDIIKKDEKNKEFEEYINNCYNEINILKSLNNNDNIVKYVEDYEENGHLNIIMEYGGKNLYDFIHDPKNVAIEEKDIKEIVLQICNGLRVIHKAKIIHRDLKPENIFINEKNKIKIGDFGTSTKLETNKDITYTMEGKATNEYKAPEIAQGSEITNKVDIYSLGCIIYELFNKSRYHDDKLYRDEGLKKINTDIYNSKWQDLIDLLVKSKSSERPDINKVIDYISDIK